MKTTTAIIAILAMAVVTGTAQAGGISSISFSYGQTINQSQPYMEGNNSQQALSFGIAVGGGCAQPVYQPVCQPVVVGYPPVIYYAPRPVVVMPPPVYPMGYAPHPTVVMPYGAAAMAARNIGMAHAAAARNIGKAHAAAARGHHPR